MNKVIIYHYNCFTIVTITLVYMTVDITKMQNEMISVMMNRMSNLNTKALFCQCNFALAV